MKLLGAIGILALVALAFFWQRAEQRARTAEARVNAADSTMRALDSKSAWQPAEGVELSQADLAELQRIGFTDPARQLGEDLVRHPELIPFPGEVGGSMAFRQPVRVLSSRWVMANFDDGHVGGSAILEFEVLKDGHLGWKMRASHLD